MKRVTSKRLSTQAFEEPTRGNTPPKELVFQVPLVKGVPFVRLITKSIRALNAVETLLEAKVPVR